jgi:hypothetical protein
LLSVLEASPSHPLAAPEAAPSIGVYALYLGVQPPPVYIGKVVGAPGLNGRLREHARKIRGRQNVELADVRCRHLNISQEWEVARAEAALIKHYNPPWNRMRGFGMHVPGSGRPGRPGYRNEWDELYPPRS